MKNEKGKPPDSKPPHHPHDLLFKAVFKRPSNVREVLEAKAPKELLAILLLEKLRLSDASYVDEFLAEQMADVVLACETDDGSVVEIAMILEHKSYLPSHPPHQIMRYQNLGWGKQIGAEDSSPTPIIPFVFYHGPDKWTVKPWPSYLRGWRKEFEPYTPLGGYVFINLSEMADEEIKRFRSGFLVTALLLMKHRFEREYLLDNLVEIVNFVESDAQTSEENLQQILRYLQALQSIKWDEAKQKLRRLKYTTQAMTVLEDIKMEIYHEAFEEGIEKGLDLGEEKTKYIATYNMLQNDFQVETITNLLNVTKIFVTGVKKQLPLEEEVTKMLKAKVEDEKIAQQLKVKPLFVIAVKEGLKKK